MPITTNEIIAVAEYENNPIIPNATPEAKVAKQAFNNYKRQLFL